MTEQPEALRLADKLEGWSLFEDQAAAELRRLHYLNEARRNTHEALGLRIAALEQAGRQALEALGLVVWTNNPPVTDAIAALRERLAQPTCKQSLQVEELETVTYKTGGAVLEEAFYTADDLREIIKSIEILGGNNA